MIGFLTKYLQSSFTFMNENLSTSLHNYTILMLLGLSEAIGLSLLIRFLWTGQDIPVGALTLFEYVLAGLLGGVGIVAVNHTYKAVKGVEGDSKDGAPPLADAPITKVSPKLDA